MRNSLFFSIKRTLLTVIVLLNTAYAYSATITFSDVPSGFNGSVMSPNSVFDQSGSGLYGGMSAYQALETDLGAGYLLQYDLSVFSNTNGTPLAGNFWAFVAGSYALNGNDSISHGAKLYFDKLSNDVAPGGNTAAAETTVLLNDAALLSENGYAYFDSDSFESNSSVTMEVMAPYCLAGCYDEVLLNLAFIDFVQVGNVAQLNFIGGAPQDSILYQSNYGGLSLDENWEYTESWSGSHSLALAPVPVPAAAWLFGSALIGLVGIGRKRRA